MARRFPVTARNVSGGSPWRAIIPQGSTIGGRFEDSGGGRAYEQTNPTSLFARTRFTVGVLFKQVLFQPQPFLDAPGTSSGHLVELDQGSGSGAFVIRQEATDYAHYVASVNAVEADSNEAVTGDGAGAEAGPSGQEGLILQTLVCDDDAYPDSSWYINLRRQGGSVPATWASAGTANGYFRLGGSGGWHHIVGVFYHLDAMDFTEITALYDNIQLAKDIPDQDFTGYGTVPDHIWSVKRAMQPGTNGVANWVSDGAVGGETLLQQDTSLQVVEFESGFASVR